MSNNFFQTVDSNLTKKQNENLYKKQTDGKGDAIVHDPVLFRAGSGKKLFFLVGIINSEAFYRKIYRLIVEIVQEKIDVTFLYVYKYRFTPEELSELGTDLKFLLSMSRTDLQEYIPPGSKVITPGAVVYTITKDTNIQSIGFNALNHYCLDNNLPLTNTSFYSPEIKSFVYPVESTFKWLRKSNKAVVEIEEGLFSLENVGFLKRDFYGEFFKHQILKATQDNRNAVRVPSLKIEDVPNPDEFLLANIGERKVALDIETTGLDHWDSEILCVTLAFDSKVGYHLDWGKTSPGALTSFLEGKFIIGANFKFDIRHLYAAGVRNLKIDFDTLNAGHCLNENRSNSLKSHAFYYTYHGGYDLPLEKYKLAHPECKTNFGKIPKKHLIPYAGMDACETFKVYEEISKELALDPQLEYYYYNQVIPQLNAFSEMEVEGVYINWDKVREKEKVFLGYLAESEEKIHKLFEEEAKDRGIVYERINLGSKPVLARLLEDLGWPEFSRGKSKQFITKKEHLEDWARLGYKAAEELIRWNQIRSLLSTFIGNEEECTGMWQYRAPDGKIYPTYSTMLAKTHRNRSSQPNMQNIPKNNEFSKDIRELFSLPEGCSYILGIDYDGLQLRIGAILSKDATMRETFLSGDGDLHSRTAQGVLARHLTIEEFKEQLHDSLEIKNIRKSAKYINFLLEFGGGARNLAKNFIARNWSHEECMDYIHSNSLKIENADIRIVENKGTEDERTVVHRERGLTDEQYTVAKDIRKKFFETYPGLKVWIDSMIEEASERGFVRSAFGARRHLPQMLYEGPDHDGKSYANQAVNSPVQNFEAIVVGSAMVRFQQFRKTLKLESRLFVNVHDELGYYIATGEEDVMFDIMEIMEYDHPECEGVPLTVEGTLSNPKDKDNPSYWGFGEELRKEEAYETYGSRRERI